MTRDIHIFYRAVVFLFCGAMNYDEKNCKQQIVLRDSDPENVDPAYIGPGVPKTTLKTKLTSFCVCDCDIVCVSQLMWLKQ